MTVDLAIPVMVEKVMPPDETAHYRARPVFFPDWVRTDVREDRAVRRLQEDLRKEVAGLAAGLLQERLALWGFHPVLEQRRLDFVFNLRRHTLRTRLFLVTFGALGRTLGYSPLVPEICFEILPGQRVEDRAQEAYSEHFKALEKREEPLTEYQFTEVLHARLDTVEIRVQVSRKVPDSDDDGPSFAVLGDLREVSGAQELERTGRCLNRLYPNELERALCREAELTRLEEWHEPSRSGDVPGPVVLVGPNQVGKTAVLHEWIRRRQERPRSKPPQVWLLSPQRLISGMSYLGQWEQRVIAMFEEAARERHVLYFDDLLGLFHAGKSRDSNLTVGQVLKLHLEEGKLRVIAEATPEAWRKVREVDRGFADLFRVIHVREPDEREICRILIRVLQEMEAMHGCRFSPEVLPLIMELPRRFVRGRAFPGKGADMLRQLAAGHAGREIGKGEVFRFFEQKTGVRQKFMDRQQTLESRAVTAFFRERIVAQEEAVAAMVESIVLAKAQLNDPARPVASLLFLGPTGVGKTECAKALAEYYFGSADRLLRFDMNEFGGWDSVARLIGSFGGRQGALTGAVRRRPHAVLLLDEIEKAHPDVIDLLLQVLDDGRLTDANGVTSDFCNTIIVLTSNLGAREAKSRVGFGSERLDAGTVHVDAARAFFRPEFFNRLDRVVAFHELDREHIGGIVHHLVRRALRRHGLQQRQLSLSIGPEVHDHLAGLGFVREFGARALRRAVEDHLVEPIAIELCGAPRGGPAFLRARVEDGRVKLLTRSLTASRRLASVPSGGTTDSADALVHAANEFLLRIQAEMDAWMAEAGDAAAPHYYLVKEQLVLVRAARDRLETRAETIRDAGRAPVAAGRERRRARLHVLPAAASGELLEEIFRGADPGKLLQRCSETTPGEGEVERTTRELLQQAALAHHVADPKFAEPDRFLIRFQVNGADLGGRGDTEERFELYRDWIGGYLDWLSAEPAVASQAVAWTSGKRNAVTEITTSVSRLLGDPGCFLYGEGPGLAGLLASEEGLQLLCHSGHLLEYGGIEVVALRAGETLPEACRRACGNVSDLMERTSEVIRIRHAKGWFHDFRTGRLGLDRKVSLWTFLAPLLPVPPEFTE